MSRSLQRNRFCQQPTAFGRTAIIFAMSILRDAHEVIDQSSVHWRKCFLSKHGAENKDIKYATKNSSFSEYKLDTEKYCIMILLHYLHISGWGLFFSAY